MNTYREAFHGPSTRKGDFDGRVGRKGVYSASRQQILRRLRATQDLQQDRHSRIRECVTCYADRGTLRERGWSKGEMLLLPFIWKCGMPVRLAYITRSKL
jgi:hypothetical protein